MTNENKICYVVGAMSLTPNLRPFPAPGDFVIAADRGFDSLMAYGVVPDLAVGDFDSLGHVPDHNNVIELPVEKDDTDMAFAIRQGLDKGYRRFILLGGVGGRLDHTMGNLQLLDWLTTQGAQGFLAGEKTIVTAIRDEKLELPASLSGSLTVLCNSDKAEGVTLEGLKYGLTDADMSNSYPVGVSNEFLGQPASVEVKKGSLTLIWEDKGDFYSQVRKLWLK